MKISFVLFVTICSLVTCLPHHKKDTDTDTPATQPIHKHGHSQVKILDCDDTVNGIGMDWAGDDDEINEDFYKCKKIQDKIIDVENVKEFANEHCEPPPIGYHVCLDQHIVYNVSVPMGGPHRPVWVTYGEYLFLPPQRWIHAIEHGAAAFLYDPCADKSEIDLYKKIARSCLRRHVITPYNNLPKGQLFNIVTFGCRLEMNKVTGNENEIKKYLRAHAIKDGPEFPLGQDGEYNFGLIEKPFITDIEDKNICPE